VRGEKGRAVLFLKLTENGHQILNAKSRGERENGIPLTGGIGIDSARNLCDEEGGIKRSVAW